LTLYSFYENILDVEVVGAMAIESNIDALMRINAIMSDDRASATYKAIALMKEAVRITEHPSAQSPHKIDLFTAQNPYALCVTHFSTLLEDGKNHSGRGFDPTALINFQGSNSSAYCIAEGIRKEHYKKNPQLKCFIAMIRENFPLLVEQADTNDKRFIEDIKNNNGKRTMGKFRRYQINMTSEEEELRTRKPSEWEWLAR
jgi:hypothetical protein